MPRVSPRRRPLLAGFLALLGLGASTAGAQGQGGTGAPDPRLERNVEALRRLSVAWETRSGPERQVVDQVCLVPDAATFLEALSTWDRRHWFPILIDDVELTFKFLRAFRPARVVRHPRRADPIPPDQLWERTLAAVGKTWGEPGAKGPPQAADAPPRGMGPTPPGVVLASADAPMLAGAAALAAGRFQPLLRWGMAGRWGDVIGLEEARAAALSLEERVSGRIDNYAPLGDDCDFLTLAGDWPYRYSDPKGTNALDDLLGRVGGGERWAYAGRLLGDERTAVYRAMCSLFLPPRSALLFSTYSQTEAPWTAYSMSAAADILGRKLSVTHRSGDRADLSGWRKVFGPINRFDLVLINSSGNPSDFNIAGGPGFSYDVPPTGPAAVAMIHSWSCANPEDPETVAGRWLANGAFIFYGSVFEPYLDAFRPPGAVGSLLAEEMPMPACVRRMPPEPFSNPWRLIYLGDPMYRLESKHRRDAPRLDTWPAVAGWTPYPEYRRPDDDASADARCGWAIKRAVFEFQHAVRPRQEVDLLAFVRSIPREQVSAKLRPFYDAVLIDLCLDAGQTRDLVARLSRISDGERSPQVVRLLEQAEFAEIHRLINAQDEARAIRLWEGLVRRRSWPREFLHQATRQVGLLAERRERLEDWRARLRSALRDADRLEAREPIEEEIRRVAEVLARRRK